MIKRTTCKQIKSVLTDDRKSAIKGSYNGLLEQLKKHRKEHMKVAIRRPIDLKNPAWIRVSPGPPNRENTNSYRFCIGFQNVGCKYREQDKLGLGCLNCGYYARTAFGDVDPIVIIDQFKTGLQSACEEPTSFNSIEFLNDGSFLNKEEFDLETQGSLLQLARQMPRVERVLVESKPEHVIKQALEFVLDNLREDQNLEIGIGFESADDFVRETCINKGISITDFENSVPGVYYEPLSYWAVLEIIARFGLRFHSKTFCLRVGAREDMDDVLKAPAIYTSDGETFEPFDFVVYESIQRFNQHGNLFRLFSVISEVYLKFQEKALTSPDSPLRRWLDENEIDTCSTYKFVEDNRGSILKEKENPDTQYDIKMMTTVYGVLDIIEGYSDVAPDLKNEIDKAFVDESPSALESSLLRCFEKVSPELVLKVKVIARQETRCAEIFFDVTDLLTFEKFSIWSRFFRK